MAPPLAAEAAPSWTPSRAHASTTCAIST
jgi:hypothetical protein